MVQATERGASRHGLEHHLVRPRYAVNWNQQAPELYEAALERKQGQLAFGGPLSVTTGEYTGRSPKDKFIVQQAPSSDNVWWGSINQPFDADKFDALHQRVADYLSDKELFVQDLHVGADPAYRMPLRVVTDSPWHALFARTMFIRPPMDELEGHVPQFTILHAPTMSADPERDGTRTRTFIIVNIEKQLILIGGTEYGGEIKKSIFSIMNYLLPLQDVMSMHCSANVGDEDDVALFFGLSGTGKTTLSSDPKRTLIGDDEHGWSPDGVFNFEGGCYAKVINLSAEAEPDIYAATRRFGTVLENCVLTERTREIVYEDKSLTENTRAVYPLDGIAHASRTGRAGHPRNILFLTADAFGVLPPIARLTPEQASYYFLSGYTAKVAGTERGLTEPEATFSTCFGAVFMTLNPNVYGRLLAEKIRKHNPDVWLVNTGWTGGKYGVGRRMSIAHTRAIVDAALNGTLKDVEFVQDPIFGFDIPTSVPDVPASVLIPKNAWSDPEAFDRQAIALAERFHKNFKQYADVVDAEITNAGPLAGR